MEEPEKSASKVERTPSTNEVVLFYVYPHRQHERERPDMERKYMNSDKVQRKEPELTNW